MAKGLNFPLEQIPASVKYISEVTNVLPDNCIYNKVLTGAGCTTIALTNPEDYVICVPFVSLIENKMSQISNIFGVYKKFKIKDLKKYLADESIPVKKIMVTYDSLSILMKHIDSGQFKILIDEVHILHSSYLFRNKACRIVVDNYSKFKNFCFLTATMTEPDFVLTELSHIPIREANWEVVKEVNVVSTKCDSNVIHTVAFLVESFLNDVETGNAHIFVNSVDFIRNVVKHCKLTDENTRAVWSLSSPVKTGLVKGKALDTAKKINFYTSTCFEGCDILDTEGKIYIVSDGTKAHSLTDISTSFTQICGRIRNSKYEDTVTHIYSTTRYDINMSYEDYKKHIEQEIEDSHIKSNAYNGLPGVAKEEIMYIYKKREILGMNSYIGVKENNFSFDENLVKLDLYNFKVTKCLYKVKVNLALAYELKGYSVTEVSSNVNRVVVVNPKNNFKETVEECEKGDSDFYLYAIQKYDFLADAIAYVGYEEMKKLDYNTTNIRRLINNRKFVTAHDKIKAELKLNYKITEGVFVSLKELKEIIGTSYKNLNSDKIPKASDIEKYYKVEKTSKTFKGEKLYGYNIIKEF